jgi:hypothetical protein
MFVSGDVVKGMTGVAGSTGPVTCGQPVEKKAVTARI